MRQSDRFAPRALSRSAADHGRSHSVRTVSARRGAADGRSPRAEDPDQIDFADLLSAVLRIAGGDAMSIAASVSRSARVVDRRARHTSAPRQAARGCVRSMWRRRPASPSTRRATTTATAAGAPGDAITFLRGIEGLSFSEARERAGNTERPDRGRAARTARIGMRSSGRGNRPIAGTLAERYLRDARDLSRNCSCRQSCASTPRSGPAERARRIRACRAMLRWHCASSACRRSSSIRATGGKAAVISPRADFRPRIACPGELRG